jgi:hypothetical protein
MIGEVDSSATDRRIIRRRGALDGTNMRGPVAADCDRFETDLASCPAAAKKLHRTVTSAASTSASTTPAPSTYDARSH